MPDNNSTTATLCDHDLVFMTTPPQARELLVHLERIDRQAQNAVTGKEPVNAQAMFVVLDEIKAMLARADRSGRFALLASERDRERAREAAAKLANT